MALLEPLMKLELKSQMPSGSEVATLCLEAAFLPWDCQAQKLSKNAVLSMVMAWCESKAQVVHTTV